eukprot:2441969-Pleurochrysis_carterae.AAC.3
MLVVAYFCSSVAQFQHRAKTFSGVPSLCFSQMECWPSGTPCCLTTRIKSALASTLDFLDYSWPGVHVGAGDELFKCRCWPLLVLFCTSKV